MPKPPGPIPGWLLIADRGNDRVLLVDGRGRVLWRYPRATRAPAMPFYFDDDVFFGPDYRRIVSNQEDQHTIEVLSFPGGRLLWHYGHVNRRGTAPGYLNTPDDAYLLPHDVVSVADAYNCRVIFISKQHTILRQIGRTGVCSHDPPRTLGAINAATPLPEGRTLIAEIAGWIDEVARNGKLIFSTRVPVGYPSDPQWLGHGQILLTDFARPGRVLIVNRHGQVLWSYGPASGPGMLDHPSLAIELPNGLIAVNDDYRDRVVLISRRTGRIVWQYGHTDVAGTKSGYLNTPDGMTLLPTAVAARVPAIRALVRKSYRPSSGSRP